MLTRLSRGLYSRFATEKFEIKRDPYKSLLVYFNSRVDSEEMLRVIDSHEREERNNNSNAIWLFLSADNL